MRLTSFFLLTSLLSFLLSSLLSFATLATLLSHAAAAEIRVKDFQQREIVLEQPAERIIALAPHLVENVFSAGAGDKLVGVVSYSNYPEQATQIEVVGSYKSWSLESIAAADPDLILMWAAGNGINKLPSLTRLGVPVYVSEPRQLSDIPAAIRNIGKLAGTKESSETEARRVEAGIEALRNVYAGQDSVSVLYQVWNDPLQTVNGEHMISNILKLCGARNAFADAVSLAPRISVESVLHRNPDAIIASGMGESRPEWLDEWRAYPSLTAVQSNALFFVPPDYIQRPTARILIGATSICQQLHTLRE